MKTFSTRLLQHLAAVAVLVSLNFALPRLAPGDPLDYTFGDQTVQLEEADRERLLRQFGLDRPLPEQFAAYIHDLARGELGFSIQHRRPVAELLRERLPWTVGLVGSGLLLAAVIGVGLAARAGRVGGAFDHSTLVTATVLNALPGFWVGMLLLGLFGLSLGWFPVVGLVTASPATGVTGLLKTIHGSVLPVVTVALGAVGAVMLTARTSLREALEEPHLLTTRGAGIPEPRILLAHVLPNAALPIITVVLIHFGGLFSGAVVIEAVFSYPGLGSLLYESVLARDYPVLQGAFLLIAAGVILANLCADLAYPLLDPRLRRPAMQA